MHYYDTTHSSDHFFHFLIDYYHDGDDEIQCYITGNNSQSYSGY